MKIRAVCVRTHRAHLTLTSVGILARAQCYTCRILAKNETTIYGSPFCPADIEMERNEVRRGGRGGLSRLVSKYINKERRRWWKK